MSSHNIHFHDKIKKIPKISLNMFFCFLFCMCVFFFFFFFFFFFELSKGFPRDSKRISQGKLAIGVRVIEGLLYWKTLRIKSNQIRIGYTFFK